MKQLFRYWTTGTQDCDAWEKGNNWDESSGHAGFPLKSMYKLPGQGGRTQAEDGSLPELKRKGSKLREFEMPGIWGTYCQRRSRYKEKKLQTSSLGALVSVNNKLHICRGWLHETTPKKLPEKELLESYKLNNYRKLHTVESIQIPTNQNEEDLLLNTHGIQ